MKKISAYILICSLLYSSCSSEQEENANLKVSAYLTDAITRAPINDFVAGNKIGIFTTYGTLNQPYYGVKSNAISSYDGVKWISDPVSLTGKMATIYAYYPYSEDTGNGENITVETASQTDYLFGKGSNTVNMTTPNVTIGMKHALSKLSFKVKKVNYPANAVLKSISIAGANSYSFCSEGTLNCETGIITGKKSGTVSLSCNDNLGTSYIQNHELLVFPLSSTLDNAGDVTATFSIQTDVANEVYKVAFPPGTKWERGVSYVYPLTLDGYGLHLNNTDVSITPWGNTLLGNGSTMY